VPAERLFNLHLAGILTVVGYVMGTLYERKEAMTTDIRESSAVAAGFATHDGQREIRLRRNQRVCTRRSNAEVMGLSADRVELLRRRCYCAI